MRPLCLVFLAACAAGSTGSDTDGEEASTSCEDPPRTPLAGWDDARAGVSLRDHVGFGLGTFTGPLAWADGGVTTYRLELTEGPAWLADASGCAPLLVGELDWTLVSADGRLDLAERYEWVYDPTGSPRAVTVDGSPTFPEVGVEPMSPDSVLRLRLWVDLEGGSSVTLREDLELDPTTLRICLHATSGDPAWLGCADHPVGSTAE